MSSVNLPKDPFSIDSSRVSSQSGDLSQAESSIIANKDTLEAASDNGVSTRLTPRETGAPTLTTPQSSDTSIVGAFRAWSEAARAFRSQLSASDAANLEARSKFSALAVAQAAEFSKIIADKEAAIQKLMNELQGQLDELNKKIKEMEDLAKNQQGAIDNINSGNAREQQEYSKLVRAYDQYVANMKSIGAKDLGNGKFERPDDPEAAQLFDRYTTTYQGTVTNFNQYWKGRSADIEKYNKTTAEYNQKIAEYNKAINDFIKDNNLTDFVEKNKDKFTLPQLSQAAKRSLDGYQSEVGSPPQNCEPPSYARSIAQVGPSAVPKLPNFNTSFDTHIFKQEMYNNAYESKIAPFDQAIKQYNVYSSYVTSSLENIDKALLATDPLLNSKALAQQLLTVKPNVSQASSLSGSLAMQTMGLDDSNMQAILGALLIKEAIAQSNAKIFDKSSHEKKEEKIEQLTHKIMLLSVGLLSNQSLQSLLPSLGIISDTLASLPKNSPAFAILFAVSLTNRVGEDVKHGINSEALQNFLNSIPEFAILPPQEKADLVTSLASSLNIGHLLVVGKLLEDSLGLQGLLSHILPALSPALNPNQMIAQAKQEDQQGELELQIQIQEHFIEKGYPEDKAQFFAQVGTELTQNGLLTPNVTANISEKTIDQPLLEKSIAAELALSPQYSLQNAKGIAQEVISRTFNDAPYLSANQFRSALESHLTDLRVKNSSEIAIAAVLTPPIEKLLAPVGLSLTSPTQNISESARPFVASVPPTSSINISESNRPSTAPVTPNVLEPNRSSSVSTQTKFEPHTLSTSPQKAPEIPQVSNTQQSNPISSLSQLSSNELVAIIEKRTLQLLVPQLGPQLAKQISQELAKAIFGHSNPDSRDVANLKSPYSLVNVMNDQLYNLNIENHENWANAVHETFTDSLKTMTSFPAFARKVQDPAYKYVLASSIIYGNQGRKNAIDIPI